MNNKETSLSLPLLSAVLFFLTYVPVWAQQVDPSTWKSFVAGSSNRSIRDTFRIQTFMETPSFNEWSYEVSGNTSLFDPADEGITDAPDGSALKMMPGSRFRVELPSHEGHTEVYIKAIYAPWKLMLGEKLLVTADRSVNPLNNLVLLSPPYNNYSRLFRQDKKESIEKNAIILIKDSPFNLQLDVAQVSDDPVGFYALDSVYAYGEIKDYSLFTGTGAWQEVARWSHQPAYRQRKAMINGEVTIDNPFFCNQIHLGNGSLTVSPGQQLNSNRLTFCGQEASFFSSGQVNINNDVSIYRTFPSTGRWYFISFPFDVYPEGIDTKFKLMDDTPNDGGNYFYLYTYNGDKRSQEDNAEGNWEVVSAQIPDGQPIFEKGKGYLIALDEKADTQTLSFTSVAGSIPSDFGKNGQLSIPVSFNTSLADEANRGWYLCGNPLPCPLPLRAISSEELDGYAYIYDGNTYIPYALDEDYAIPPFSAFFVKARQATEILIDLAATTKSNPIISISEPLYETKAEPQASGSTVSTGSSPEIKRPNSYLNATSLFLEDLLMPGAVYIWDIGGRLYWKKQVNAGSSVIHLPSALPPGNYIIRVDTKNYKHQHKLIWNQFASK